MISIPLPRPSSTPAVFPASVRQQGIELLRQQMENEALERAALVEVLTRRRAGKFISKTKMDDRLARMLTRKRQTHAVRG